MPANSDIIHTLSSAVINQIAAGEVVQRPSSVVKELMENSIDAGASKIDVVVADAGRTLIQVIDNGKGMSEEMVNSVTDPFTTGRTTRKVGLGIPLVKHACEITGGYIDIKSELGVGTTLYAEFGLSHIDRQPLGDIVETMHQLFTSFEEIDIV